MKVSLTSLFNLLIGHLRLTYSSSVDIDVLFLAILPPLRCIFDLRFAHIGTLVYEVVECNASKRYDFFVAVFGPQLVADIIDLESPMLDLWIESVAAFETICGWIYEIADVLLGIRNIKSQYSSEYLFRTGVQRANRPGHI